MGNRESVSPDTACRQAAKERAIQCDSNSAWDAFLTFPERVFTLEDPDPEVA